MAKECKEWYEMFDAIYDTVKKAAIAIIAAMLVGALSLFFK